MPYDPPMQTDLSVLTEDEVLQFHKDGFVVREGFLSPEQIRAASEEVDRYADTEPRFDGRNVWKYDELCSLITDPTTLAIMDQLMGDPNYALHHCHAARHNAGLAGVGWHHDYEQIPQVNRSHTQVHVLHYLAGLNGTIGDMLLLRRSHRAVMRRDALWFCGTEEIPGTVVLNNLAPGSVVFAHSALVHARRPQPGGEGTSRYFIDIVFMQAGIKWPSYGREGWRDTLAELDKRLHDPHHPHLFDADAFFEISEAVARLEGLEGSVALHLPEADPNAPRKHGGAIPVVQ
jgi:hypothetical protein